MALGTAMKTGTIILFTLPRKEENIGMPKACKLYRELYGYNNTSYYGKYHSRVQGLLERLGGIRLFKSAMLVRNEDAGAVEELLKRYNAHILKRKVILSHDDVQELGMIDT